MQEVVSASTGTTATGRPRNSGRSSCSTDAKYEFMSTNRYLTDIAAPPDGIHGSLRHLSSGTSKLSEMETEIRDPGIGSPLSLQRARFASGGECECMK